MSQRRPLQRSVDDVEEIEHALTRWSRYGLDLPRPSRLELCKVGLYPGWSQADFVAQQGGCEQAIDGAVTLQYMGFASYPAGGVIFKQGDHGEHFYIILSGAVDVMVTEKMVRICSFVVYLTALGCASHRATCAAQTMGDCNAICSI